MGASASQSNPLATLRITSAARSDPALKPRSQGHTDASNGNLMAARSSESPQVLA